ncbi:unnamed protein product [Trifolium pratense]|uniref:Uncharacterized protein n=1 Tax=Trifolium pratense TaxID=57577 RepID=A0ACB0J2Y2_TRIPR|nr:unnamed protein product [Trifolium pratense]
MALQRILSRVSTNGPASASKILQPLVSQLSNLPQLPKSAWMIQVGQAFRYKKGISYLFLSLFRRDTIILSKIYPPNQLDWTWEDAISYRNDMIKYGSGYTRFVARKWVPRMFSNNYPYWGRRL